MIIRTYMEINIPKSLIEAGRVMGANEARIFVSIVLPLCLPILATIVLWIAVGAWNDWTSTLYYIQKPSLYTLQYILMQTIKESERMQSLIQAAVQAGKMYTQNVSKICKCENKIYCGINPPDMYIGIINIMLNTLLCFSSGRDNAYAVMNCTVTPAATATITLAILTKNAL